MNKNFTLPIFFKSALSSKLDYKKRSRFINSGLLSIIMILFSFIKTEAQTGLINDDFSTGSTFNWVPATAGSTGSIQNGKYLINFPAASGGKYRADFKKNGGITFHAGNYPIIAIKINKPPRCNYFFDTNLGAYNGTNNNGTKIITETGNVFYWDLSTGKLGTTTISTSQVTTLSSFQLKIADIVLTDEEIAANKTNYQVDWVKSFASVDALRAFLNPSGTTNPQFEFSGAFVHPGLLHNATDLNRIKDLVAQQAGRPYQSYQALVASGKASATYTMKGPYSALTRDASLTIDGVAGGTVKNNVESDFLAAYYNALMYKINGNEAHALKAIQILDAYSATTKSIVGVDAELNGLYGFMLVNAAEIMRSAYPSWPAAKVLQCQNMLKSVFYPIIGNFKPCAHGNWDIICMKALMGIAIFTEDVAMFNKTVNYYYYGEGNGSIKNYILTDAGQLQESNRDQPHVMLAIGSLAELAEMALKQGVDLYSANNNAIMRGYEYTSQYNLGMDVPYQTSYDYCEKNYQDYTPTAISSNGRGELRAVFEIAYNHYVYRKGLTMPQTMAVLGRMGAEGAPFGADNPGYGSLLFYLNPASDYTFANQGLIDDNFTSSTGTWKAVTTGSVATAEDGQLKITTVIQSNGKGRGDMQNNITTVHPGNYPILAIKMKKPVSCNFTFDTNLGSYGNAANKWTGKVGEEIYYYDLSKTGFGATPTMLSATAATTFSTFQFKVADIASGETSYSVDWVKTVKTVAELTAFDPATGLINDNFSTTTDGWNVTTSGANAIADNGHLRVGLAKQTNGSYRGDIKRTAGATLYPANYPIVAIKLKKPIVANITFDSNLGSFGNGSNKWTAKVGNDIYYFDLSKTGFGTNGILTTPTALTTFQFKIADITSGETDYQVDWVKTVKTVAELQALVAPAYQTITFAPIDVMKVGTADFGSAVSSSGLPVTLLSSNSAVATIVNGKIHIVGSGNSEISATQAGDANYYAADVVKRNLVVVKKDQTITYTPLPQKTINDGDFSGGAVASSGLPVSNTSSNENVATIVNGLIHIVGAGVAEITASQTGNDTYNAAPSIAQLLTVTKTFYTDGDHDGFGSTSTASFPVNDAPEGYATNNTDCNDNDVTVHQPIQYYVDTDKDGFGSTATAMLCSSVATEGYATNNSDCNDSDATVHQPIQYYVDADKDGFGSNVTAMLCTSVAPQGYATNNTDCNDSDAAVHEPILYYVDADKDGFGSTVTAMLCSSVVTEGYAINNTDCNDNDAAVHQPVLYYVDADKDGFGSNVTAMLCSSVATEGYATNNSDCNDSDATVHQPIQYYVDADKDGFGSTATAMLCSSVATEGYATNNSDCNDNDATVHQPVLYYVDADKDGFGSTATAMLCASTAPEGYAINNTDCNDNDVTVHEPIQYYVDADKDGFGSTATAMLCSSTAPEGYATNNSDCNDNDATVHQPIQYYVDADKDGFGSTATTMLCSSVATEGYATNNSDCNDSDATVHQPIQYYVDADKDGFGSTTTAMLCSSVATEGYATNNTDCNDNDATVHQPIQYYVDADKDGFGSTATTMLCSSVATEGYATNNSDCNDSDATVHQPIQYYVDADKDGFGSTATAMLCASTAPEGYATNNTDCNDSDATVHQPIQYFVDADKDGFGSTATAMLCSSTAPEGYATNNSDCNDSDATVHQPIQYYVDADKDGFGSTATEMLCSSTATEGYATNNTDCNDSDAAVHQPIQYYVDADKDGFGSTTTAMFCASTSPEGYATNNSDCNDSDVTVHQPIQYYVDADKDGFGSNVTAMLCTSVAPQGYATNNTDCDDTNAVQLTATIPNVYALNAAVDEKNTIYIGYGPTSLSISATPAGGTAPYAYKWSTNQTAKTIAVSAVGTYTVIVTDAKGCQTTTSIVIKTINVQCGNSGDKVMVCHNGQQICVSSNSVQSHLNHGDKLGSCSYMVNKATEKDLISEENATEDVSVYPNPVTSLLNVKVNEVQSGATLELYNSIGMKVLSQALKSTSEVMSLDTLPSGIYLLKINNGNETTVKNIIKE